MKICVKDGSLGPGSKKVIQLKFSDEKKKKNEALFRLRITPL